ncbi:MAG: glycoside hydrolase family 27 protein [Clostridia bacterium]
MDEKLLAQTPPMGFNCWNTFMTDLDEDTLKEVALALKNEGFLEAGYNYFCLDDGWENKERVVGQGLDYDKEKFPSGLKAFGDFLHNLGFKFGIYTCNGTKTCAGYPGSYGYEYEDAAQFAKWGVDLVKYDNCFVPSDANSKFLYRRMGQALRETGRDILYSMCNWGFDESENWARTAGAHIYRVCGDCRDTFENVETVMSVIRKLNFSAHSGTNCFADPDFLIAGMNGEGAVSNLGEEVKPNAGYNVYRLQFSLWCMICAPLFMSHDPRKTTPLTKEILQNKKMIEISQDIAGIPAFLCTTEKKHANDVAKTEVWAKPLYNGDVAICLINRREFDHDVCAGFDSFGWLISDMVSAYDVWEDKSIGNHRGNITLKVPGRDCKVLILHHIK